MRILSISLVGVLVGLGVVARAADDGTEVARTREGLDVFQAFLKKEYPNKKYRTGPAHLDSAALRAAYPNQRFYYVFTGVPLGPGADLPKLQEAHLREVEELRKNYLSLTVRVDEKGQAMPLTQPGDYNVGLMKIASDDDARTAAAAILSLCDSDRNNPGTVEPREVTLTRSEKGWLCRVDRTADFWAIVTFDAAGKCTRAVKTYNGRFPK